MPHEDSTDEEDEEVDQKVVVLLCIAVNDAGNGDEGDWHHYGTVDEVGTVVHEELPVEEGEQQNGQGRQDVGADFHDGPPPWVGGCLSLAIVIIL